MDVSTGNVWITGCTTISIRFGKSLNMPLSLLSCVSSTSIDINSSSVSTFDSACAVPSPLHIFGGLRSILIICLLYYRHLRGFPLTALTSNDSHCQGINNCLKQGKCCQYGPADDPWNRLL
ncbi:hypothetical protein H5410_003417 [Solanum commersonii]|uniref:Uncharacterized protein n=1 Tax=Solanum commersonii TaxID=4109 RepID=A0A9J6B525_SOLCO|nr:hypothetical protein H5410_003417 [Solanum commersonii]